MIDFIYLNSTIKVKENSLLGGHDYQALAPLRGQPFVDRLVALGYGQVGASSFDQMVAGRLALIERELASLLGVDNDLYRLLMFHHDLTNIKLLYKAALSGLRPGRFDPDGLFDHNDWEKAIKYQNYDFLGTDGELIKRIAKKLPSDPRLLSDWIDVTADHYLVETYLGDEQVRDYWLLNNTLVNIFTLLRSRRLGDDRQLLASSLLVDSLYSVGEYLAAGEVSRLGARLPSVAATALATFTDLDELRLAFDRQLLSYARDLALSSSPLGPTLGYYLRQKIEIANLRALYYRPGREVTL